MLTKTAVFVFITVASVYGSSECPPALVIEEGKIGDKIEVYFDGVDLWTFSSDHFKTVKDVKRCERSCDETEVYISENGTLVIPRLTEANIGLYSAFGPGKLEAPLLKEVETPVEEYDYEAGTEPKVAKGYAYVIEEKTLEQYIKLN